MLLALTLTKMVILSLDIKATTFSIRRFLIKDGASHLVLLSSELPEAIAILLTNTKLSLSKLVVRSLARGHFTTPSAIKAISTTEIKVLYNVVLFPNLSIIKGVTLSFFFTTTKAFLFLIIIGHLPFGDRVAVPLLKLVCKGVLKNMTGFFTFHFGIARGLST